MFFFFKQKTAYEMRISDWSSDVCSSDLIGHHMAPDEGEGDVFEFSPGGGAGHIGGLEIAGRDRGKGRVEQHHGEGGAAPGVEDRSEERRVGKECVRKCRSRGSPYQ